MSSATDSKVARLAYLTQPAPGVYLLNIQNAAGELWRVEISKGQLANIIVDGAAMALRSPEASA